MKTIIEQIQEQLKQHTVEDALPAELRVIQNLIKEWRFLKESIVDDYQKLTDQKMKIKRMEKSIEEQEKMSEALFQSIYTIYNTTKDQYSLKELPDITMKLTPIKKMDIREFRKLGFLQEANRQFFHPLGLALEVSIEEDGTEYLSGIWDYREDPEGISYAESQNQKQYEKRLQNAEYVKQLMDSKAETRIKKFGSIIQPIMPPKGEAKE